MRDKLIVLSFVCLLAVSSVFAADLSQFPGMFIKDNKLNVNIVVGKNAKAEDVLGAFDVALVLIQSIDQTSMLDKVMGISKLDTEDIDIRNQNLIVVGGPCINSVAARLMGFPENCLKGFEVGKGKIKLYEQKSGAVSLLLAGTTAIDTRRVTRVMANYRDYDLSGKELIVSGVSLTNLNVKNKSD